MFVGRNEELETLESLYSKGGFQMVVIYGRRRIGKTALITQFAKDKRALYFTALEQSDKNNLRDFTSAIQNFFNVSQSSWTFDSWKAAFDYLAERAKEEPFVLLFDEFPYAAQRNEALASMLQIAIDRQLKETNLFLILCGSNQGFMESDVLGKKSPLHGRRTAQLKLGPMPFIEMRKMLPKIDVQEAFRYYGCVGGVPYYLAQIDPEESFRDNLARLFFDTSGFLYEEPMELLRQELTQPALYNSILRAIASGANRPKEITDKTGITQTSLPRYLKTLCELGIVERAVPFGENSETSKHGIYRILEASFSFWFRFVVPYVSDIESGLGRAIATRIPENQLSEYLGLRFEAVCREWLVAQALAGNLEINATSVGSWWGCNPKTRSQTDIDALAADKIEKKLLIAECKYRNSFNVSEVASSLTEKKDLIKGYDVKGLYVFTKVPIKKSVANSHPELHFVSLDEF